MIFAIIACHARTLCESKCKIIRRVAPLKLACRRFRVSCIVIFYFFIYAYANYQSKSAQLERDAKLNYHISRDKVAMSATSEHGSWRKTILQDAGYVRLLCCLTATKLYHLRQTPLALYCRETRENTLATLMLRKVFLDGEIWNAGETRNLFFSPFSSPASLVLSLSLRNLFTQSKESRGEKVFQVSRAHVTHDTERTNEKFSLSFFCRGSASRMYVRGATNYET